MFHFDNKLLLLNVAQKIEINIFICQSKKNMGVTHLICNWCGEVFSDHGHYVKYNILGLGLYYFCSDCQNIPDGHLSLPKETLNRNYILFC